MFPSVMHGRLLKARVRGVRLPFVFLSTLLLASCQTTLSLDEAKKITAKFEGQSFTPPPKTIEDITKFLDQQPNVSPSVIAKNRAAANQKRPPRLTGDDLVHY